MLAITRAITCAIEFTETSLRQESVSRKALSTECQSLEHQNRAIFGSVVSHTLHGPAHIGTQHVLVNE